jgi:hypothetical protein
MEMEAPQGKEEQAMTHDPLCEWSTPCIHGENQQHSRDTENLAVPDATYCWMCGADCTCDLIAKVREDMLAKCIAAVRPAAEFQICFAANLWSCDPMNCELCDCGMDSAGRQQIADTAHSQTEMVLDALRALQEKP